MVQIGDVITLRNSAFHNEFLQMVGFSEWSDKYLYEDQFEFVSLNFSKMNKVGDMVKTLFGSSQSRVIEIEYSNDACDVPFIIKTDLFRIIFDDAIKNKEISVSSFDPNTYNFFLEEKKLIENLEFFEQKYLEGLFEIHERENNKLAHYRHGFHFMFKEGKWKH